MRIGYSFWGFLSSGITDTPDGGRIHRLPFLKALIAAGADVVCLQKNRDLDEAREHFAVEGLTFSSHGFPDLDALVCEYRWPIPGRNTAQDMGTPGFEPDLCRQEALLRFYCGRKPTLVWDKDLKLALDAPSAFVVAEAALRPRPGRIQLLFPFDADIRRRCLDALPGYRSERRSLDLVYVGNQYERDASFGRYIDASGALTKDSPRVYGNWTKYPTTLAENRLRFPHVRFHDRLPFDEIAKVYDDAFSTVLLAPDRYYAHGQITQRLFEALASHVIPFVPREYRHVEAVVVDELVVGGAEDVVRKIREYRQRGDAFVRGLLRRQVDRLSLYAPDLQAGTAMRALRGARGDAR